MPSITLICVAGAGVGVLYGLFGVGSAFATPLLALIGVPGMAAVAGPLPALLPGSMTGAWSYSREGKVDWWVAKHTIAGALPAAICGAIVSHWVSGPALVAGSGAVLLGIGLRVLRPVATDRRDPWANDHPVLLTASAVAVGFFSGLLANGGGFLLVPLFLLMVGLDMGRATGTSLVVASVLTIPTLVTHALIGDIDWLVAAVFALGLVPGARVGALVSRRFATDRLRSLFGLLLVVFAVWFLAREIPQLIS
ncbi:MAG: sulfite exporter TauE/SafE family protein [Acidimicrobiales bacterium]